VDIQNILKQLRGQRDRIARAISALESGTRRRGRPAKQSQQTVSGRKAHRGMSVAARARIAAAKKAWWAKQKRGAKPTAAKKATAHKKASGRKGMSAAARKRLSDLMKARWVARKKQ
jgi:hypothetical protein